MTAEVKIQNLVKRYPNGTEALKGVNLEIQKGDFFALLGPNGAGKSTLVKIITTLIKKDSGHFLINNVNPENNYLETQQYIGVASQDNELDPTEKVENLIVFQGQLFGMTKQKAKQRAEELIDMFQLNSERGKKVDSLSGGNKRRLHCALALVHNPKVLFLDEPTVGMDPLARSTFWEVITKLNQHQGISVFLTTQYLEEADLHATKMALIIEGKIHYTGLVSGFKNMVNPVQNISLNDSYLTYIKSLLNIENTNN